MTTNRSRASRRSFAAMQAEILAQPHRADPTNPATANCAMWLTPEQLAGQPARMAARGLHPTGTSRCVCGNHDVTNYA